MAHRNGPMRPTMVQGIATCWLAAHVAATPASAQALASADAPMASPAPQSGASPLNRIQSVRVPLEVSLRLNEKFLGTITVAVDPKGDGEIDAQRLVALLAPAVDAKLLTALSTRIAARTRVDFADLAVDGFALRFDSLALEVIATLPPDASKPAILQLGPQQDVPVPASFDQPAKFSAGVNIAAGQRYVYGKHGGFDPVKGDLDAIANIGGFNGVTFTGGAAYDGERWRREEIRATHDMYDKAIRATLGEFTPSSTSFQGVGRILGIGVERAYSTIRPFQNTRPTGRQDFTLEHDSSVDVLVNNIRVQTIRLAAGRYNISDFPFAAGPNQVQLVVEDVGGRREILNFDVFNTTNLLTAGLSEFGAALGFRERDQLHYGKSPALTGYIYHGMSDTLTLGANGQATSDGALLGGVVVLGTPIGFFQLEGSASKRFQPATSGVAVSLDYRGDFSLRQKNDLRVVGSAVYRSATFQDAFSQPSRNPRIIDTALQVQWLAPLRVSTGLGASYALARDGGANSYRLDLTLGRSFGRLGISTTGSRTVFDDGRGNDTRVAVGLSLLLGRRDSINARYDSGTHRAEIEVARAPEGRLGEISGAVRYTRDRDANALSGRLAYINNRFDLVLNHNRIERAGPNGSTSNASDWNIRSFLGYADGSFGIGRSIDEGFVIAPLHSTLAGSRASIMSGDRVIARTGMFGPALVPIGRAYSIGHYDVKVDPLPIGYDLGAGTINVFPGYGSGYRSMIGSDASRIVIGSLFTDDGPVALASGIIEPVDPALRKTWKERGFFTNRAGRFVADRLAPGRYRLLLSGRVAAEIELNKESQGVVDVGKIRVLR